MERIRVLLADDHPVVREGLRTIIDTDPGIELVGEACDGEEAIAKVEQLRPHLVLMDLRMPRVDGLDATRHIKREWPEVAVVVLTMYDDEAYVVEAVQAGAEGYLLKDASRELLLNTIKAVHSGGLLIKSSLLTEAATNLLQLHTARAKDSRTSGPFSELTPREREVLGLLVEGHTNRQIGGFLHITELTAKKHVQSIMGKLEASDRTQAAVRAVRAGFSV